MYPFGILWSIKEFNGWNIIDKISSAYQGFDKTFNLDSWKELMDDFDIFVKDTNLFDRETGQPKGEGKSIHKGMMRKLNQLYDEIS